MKRNLIALALVLFFGNVLFASAQVVPVQGLPTGSLTLVVSEYGTLLDVRNADGTSRFGRLNRDGFRVKYKLGGEMKTVRAIGADHVVGVQPGLVSVDGNSVSVTVTTDDYALQITNRFNFYKADGKFTDSLIIRRTLKKISNRDLKAVTTTQYVDPKVMRTWLSINPTSHQREARRLKKESARRLTAFACDGCQLLERPPHDPPCLTIFCSENSASRPLLATRWSEISLRWKPRWKSRRRFAPRSPAIDDSDTDSDNAVNEMHFVVAVKLKLR